jgi:hypothetical protein
MRIRTRFLDGQKASVNGASPNARLGSTTGKSSSIPRTTYLELPLPVLALEGTGHFVCFIVRRVYLERPS